MLIQPIGAGFTAWAQEQSIPKESATGLQTLSLLFWVDFFVPRHRLSCSAAFAGVGDGLAIADAVVLVPVVPDCWQDAKNAMPIRATIRENTCLFISYTLPRVALSLWSF